MSKRKNSVFISIFCLLIMCVCGTTFVYAAINQTVTSSATVTMTATAVKGSVSGTVQNLSGVSPTPYSQSFDATSNREGETYSLPNWNLYNAETAPGIKYINGVLQPIIITFIIYNNTGDNVNMKTYCSAITLPANMELTSIKYCETNVGGTQGTLGILAQTGAGDTAYLMNIPSNKYYKLELRISVEDVNVDIDADNIEFKLTMQRQFK